MRRMRRHPPLISLAQSLCRGFSEGGTRKASPELGRLLCFCGISPAKLTQVVPPHWKSCPDWSQIFGRRTVSCLDVFSSSY